MHSCVPTGPEAAENPRPVPNHKTYMSWCWIKMRPREAIHQLCKNVTGLKPAFNTRYVPIADNPSSSDESDPIEVTEAMAHEARNNAQQALYALLAGAEGCGPAARNARLTQDNGLAEFLSRVQQEVVKEAKRLLVQRVAE